MERKTLAYLSLIVILATILRLSGLTYNPPSLNWDEVSHGYNAYSILKTGMDEWGQKFPIFNFRAYGDYPLPLNLYLTIPFIAVLGLNEFSIRLPHAILGILTVLISYFLAVAVTKREKIGLLTALFVAIEPWYLFPSRFVVQSNLSVFLLIATVLTFLNRDKNKYFLPVSIILFILTLFSYHTTRIFSPLFVIGIILLYRRELISFLAVHKKVRVMSIILISLFFLLVPIIFAMPQSKARGSVLFLIDEAGVNRIIEARQKSTLPPALSRILYNRPTYLVTEFSKHYISYFSPDFLFFKGGTQFQFSIPGRGLLYPVNLPFFYLGLLLVLIKALKGEKLYRLTLLWLLLSPIPASLTNENFTVLRSTTMLPLPSLFSAMGLVVFEGWLKGKKVLLNSRGILNTIYLLLLFVFAGSYLVNYFTQYRTNYSWSWQYGYKEAISYIKGHYGAYDKIIVTKKYGEPHEFLLFYWPWDPQKYRDDPNLIRFNQSNWYWVDRFDKFYFVNDWQIPKSGKEFVLESKGKVDCRGTSCLLVTSPGNYPRGWRKLETVNFLDGKGAFEIYENE